MKTLIVTAIRSSFELHAILEQIERRQWVTSMNVLPAVELSKNDT